MIKDKEAELSWDHEKIQLQCDMHLVNKQKIILSTSMQLQNGRLRGDIHLWLIQDRHKVFKLRNGPHHPNTGTPAHGDGEKIHIGNEETLYSVWGNLDPAANSFFNECQYR